MARSGFLRLPGTLLLFFLQLLPQVLTNGIQWVRSEGGILQHLTEPGAFSFPGNRKITGVSNMSIGTGANVLELHEGDSDWIKIGGEVLDITSNN